TTAVLSTSSYFIGGDQRGTMTIDTTDLLGQPMTEHFTLALLSNSQVPIAENDGIGTASGTMDLQTTTTTPTGGYAFVMSGIDTGGTPAAFGGIVNIDNNPDPGVISGAGSVADQDYTNALASCNSASAFAGSSISQPDPNPFGVVEFDLAALNPSTGAACLGF